MRKKKVGPSKSSTEMTFILAQKKSKSEGSRNKTKDVYNYYKKTRPLGTRELKKKG